VRSQQHIRDDGLGDELGFLRLHAGIDVASNIAVGPAVEPAVLYRGEVIGRQIIAKFIPFVHADPDLAGQRLDRQADGIAQAASENARVLPVRIAHQDRGTPLSFSKSMLEEEPRSRKESCRPC